MKELILKVFRNKDDERQEEIKEIDNILIDTVEELIAENERLLKEGMDSNE